jgi:hypothetical protein
MIWVADKTGRFAQRPHYTEQELDIECDKIVSAFLRKRHGDVSFPISTDDLTCLIEEKADFDSYADLTAEGDDVEGVTEFRSGRRPIVRISSALAEAVNRENRLRTTLTHEYGHVHFHRFLFEELSRPSQLFASPAPAPVNRCHRPNIEHALRTDWLEWQAGHCSGALLMPLTALLEGVRLFSSRRGCGGRELGAHSRDGIALIEHVSKAFQVSEQAARVRLLKRGILQEGNQAGRLDFPS